MGLSGIEIFKMLPRTNCGDCGVPTCLAFAMNLAGGKAELAACPHVSEEAKEKLADMAAPPMRTVAIGTGDGAVKIGGETVLFRHEKRFENPSAVAVLISDTMEDGEVDERLKKLEEFSYDRVGVTLNAEMAALRADSGDASRFKALVERVSGKTERPLILCASDAAMLEAAAPLCAERKPLLYAATKETVDAVAELASKLGCPVAARGKDLDETAEIAGKLASAGLKDIVLDSGARSMADVLRDQVNIRRGALVSKIKELGFPTIAFPNEMTDDPGQEALLASVLMAKYAGILVLSDLNPAHLFPLLVGRLNIFTDPQRPLATTEGIYPLGNPDENSPVLVTSNFSLTYFVISGEIENSRVPAWLLVKDTEGLSVLTAWAGGKFTGDVIGIFVKKSGIAEKVKHRKLIIPGFVAPESGAIEDELPDWKIIIGPREAANVPSFLKMWPFDD